MSTTTDMKLDQAIANEEQLDDPISEAAEYEAAYDSGVASYTKYPGGLEDIDSDMLLDWSEGDDSAQAWDRERFAARDAWDRNRTRL